MLLNTPSAMVVALIDDQALRQAVLCELADRQDVQVSVYDDASEFYSAIRNKDVGCIVVDVDLREYIAQEILLDIQARNVMAPTIMVVNCGHVAQAVAFVKNGAFDVIEKPLRAGTLSSRITWALYHWNEMKRAVKESARMGPRIATLGKRQLEIVRGLANGLSSRGVAKQLGIAHNTVRATIGQIKGKLRIQAKKRNIQWREIAKIYEGRGGRPEVITMPDEQ